MAISAQQLQDNWYRSATASNPNGQSPETLQQLLAYELGQNAYCISQDCNFKEQPDENRTNQIMDELANSKKLPFLDNTDTDEKTNQIMSGASFYVQNAKLHHGVYDFAQHSIITGSAVNPDKVDIYDSITGTAETTQRDCNDVPVSVSPPSLPSPSPVTAPPAAPPPPPPAPPTAVPIS